VNKSLFFSLIILVILVLSISINYSQTQVPKSIYVIFIWHYHQPWYYSEDGSYFILPWIRMHSVGNYYKMGYIVSKYANIKVTFTFSGSLLVQLQDYLKGKMDMREILSWKIANNSALSIDEKFSILQIPGGFFDINWNRIVNVVPEFKNLRDKAQQVLQQYKDLPENLYKERVVSSFSEQEILDLVALFNLFWIDPLVLKEQYPTLYNLRDKALKTVNYNFTREDIANILNAHRDIMSKILPLYKQLLDNGIEIVPVPYSHPLSPLLTDFGFNEDLSMHVNKSLTLFNNIFGRMPKGIWPAEQAINDDVLKVFASENLTWTITDQSILSKGGMGEISNTLKVWYASFNDRKIYVLFRNTELSNLISFTYSNYNPQSAVNDLINRILELAKQPVDNPVVIIALDGENPWEHYEEFGDTFLTSLYSNLENYQKQNIIFTTTPSEYIEKVKPKNALSLGKRSYFDFIDKDISDTPVSYTEDGYDILPRRTVQAYLPEGSWAGGELAIWIGQRQENVAWMLLKKAREDLLAKLNANSLKEAYKINSEAVENLLRAQASDWFWWYGGDGGGAFPSNPLFKAYLKNIYKSINLPIPNYLIAYFNPEASPIGTINTEVPLPIQKKPKIDGNIEKDEWSNFLNMTLDGEVKSIYIAVDPENLYFAIIPNDIKMLKDLTIGIYLTNPWRSVSPYNIQYNTFARYENRDLGMGLFYEILIDPNKDFAYINIANGKEEWINLFKVNTIAISNLIEGYISWNLLNLKSQDIVYLTAAIYKNSSLVSYATKLGLTYYIQVPLLTGIPTGKVIFEMKDPEGDDNGAGTYVYPKNPVFKPGVFDLLDFKVIDAGDSLIFKSYFKNLGGNPWNGPNGFSMQYIHIYIRTTLNLTGRIDTFGLNVNLTDDSAWHLAILIAPGWGIEPVPKGERAAIYYFNNTLIVQDDIFKVYAVPAENSINVEIKKSLLLDLDNINKWMFTVVVTSYDGYGPDRIRNFGVEAAEWVVGTGAKYAQAIVKNVVPRIMDLLAPISQDQYEQLNSFIIDTSKNITQYAKIRGYSASQPITEKTTTITETVTTTVTPPLITIKETNIENQIIFLIIGLVIGFTVYYAINIIRKKG
jgi:alpha-amylase/alpha-mannosidase (GH57 family)